MTVTDAVRRVKAYAVIKGWSKSRFAIEAGMHNTTLRDFDKKDWDPRVSTLKRLEKIIPKDFSA